MRSFNFWVVLPMAFLLLESLAWGQGVPATRTYEYDAQGNRTRASQQLRIPGLQIHAFEPSAGLPGDVINIYGRNLLQAENLSVTIQGKQAVVLRQADAVINVQVPLDVETGPVVVTVAGVNPIDLGIFTIRKDLDRDTDKLPNFVEPLIGLDPDKADSDNNGVIDGDEDSDADHLSNYGEIVMGTSMNNPDTNRDGILDGDHDTDKDDLTDGDEIRLGTDPRKADTDGDLWPDAIELITHGDPLDPKIGSRLYQAPAKSVDVVAQGIGNTNKPSNVYTAHPSVTVLLPAMGTSGAFPTNTIAAHPRVMILLPNLGEAGELELNPISAHPPVTVLLPNREQGDNFVPNLSVAKPPVHVLLPHQGSPEDTPSNLTVAKPPVQVKIEPQGLSLRNGKKAAGKSRK